MDIYRVPLHCMPSVSTSFLFTLWCGHSSSFSCIWGARQGLFVSSLIHCFYVGVGWDERAPSGVWWAQTGVQRQGLPNLLLLWVSLSWFLTWMHKQSHLLKNRIKWTKLLSFKSDLILKPFWCYSVYLCQCYQVNYFMPQNRKAI